MTFRVHIYQPTNSDFLAQLAGQLEASLDLTVGREVPERADYRILIAGRVEEDFLTASPHLETLIIPWAGLPVSTRELLQRYPAIAVHNLHHNAAPAAELAVALLLAAAKRVIPADRELRKGDWSLRYEEGKATILEGKSALVLGFGAIGRRVGRMLDSFGMRVTALRRHRRPDDPDFVGEFTDDRLAAELAKAQAVVVCLPLTDDTRELLGAEQLELLPAGAILVNIARGPIVGEQALYEACKAGKLRAGLDVWYQYPQEEAARRDTRPGEFPFAELDTVVMTPHLGGNSDQNERARARELAQLLNAAAKGERLPNRVHIDRGY